MENTAEREEEGVQRVTIGGRLAGENGFYIEEEEWMTSTMTSFFSCFSLKWMIWFFLLLNVHHAGPYK